MFAEKCTHPKCTAQLIVSSCNFVFKLLLSTACLPTKQRITRSASFKVQTGLTSTPGSVIDSCSDRSVRLQVPAGYTNDNKRYYNCTDNSYREREPKLSGPPKDTQWQQANTHLQHGATVACKQVCQHTPTQPCSRITASPRTWWHHRGPRQTEPALTLTPLTYS